MLRRTLMVLGLCIALPGLGLQNTYAQLNAGSYTFTATAGTYTPITGGTVVNAAIPDSYQSTAIALTPGFTFCGVVYTTAYMTSNGLISLGGTAGPGITQYNGIANNGGGSGIHLCPFNADQIGSSLAGAAPELRYELVGNEHVFQWKDISRTPAGTDRLSYQARLNAVTGVITYVYTVTTVGAATLRQPVIGIRTANTAGNWQSRLVANNAASSWAASVLATATGDVVRFTSSATNPKQPVNGQQYIYTPPPPCTSVPAPPVVAANAAPLSLCLTGTVNLSLASPIPPAAGYSYQWQRSITTAAGPYTTVANTAGPTHTTSTDVSSFYRCRILCNNDSITPYWTSGASAQVVVTKPGTPAVTAGSRCGPGSVALSATLPATATSLNWYAAATGGAPLASGTSFNTPLIAGTTTFYAAAVNGTCIDARVPVLATVNPSPVVNKTVPAVVCNNAITAMTLNPVTPYPVYTWTPLTNLYTDAAATVPYAGGSATTVYMKTTNVGVQTYRMMAGDPTLTTGCTFSDTIRIWSQPGNVKIKGQPDTICVGGTSTLVLDTISGYYPGSIQWQDSIPGTSAAFTDIAGAVNPAYTTPALTFGQNRYYRALIKAGGDICQSPVKYLVIADPSIIDAPDSFHCGPGKVTLTAQVAGNSTVRWYTSPTAPLPVGTGSPWVTPLLAATTPYYVAAGSGSPQPAPTFMGAGTGTVNAVYGPYYRGTWAQKVQYLIRASEMQAAGFSAGFITGVGFSVTTAGTVLNNVSMSLKNTTLNALPTAFQTGMQPTYTAATYLPVANSINDHVFQTPFYWDGTSNIILEKCANNGATGTGSTVRYTTGLPAGTAIYSTANVATHCATPTSTVNTTTNRPNIRITMKPACESPRREVRAFIHPKPVVDLGPDINECVDAGTVKVLDAGTQPNLPQFIWDNGATTQVRGGVTASGTYSVKVTNQYTCATSDTINVVLRTNPVVKLGNDTTVCNGVTLPLNAGPEGISYFWNTGENSQEIQVSSEGTYNVFVTNSQGCIKADTIVVKMAGELPTISGINITNNGVNTFTFTAVNPQHVIGYDWDFGDGTPHSALTAPTHVYANTGNYVVVLRLSSSCGFRSDSTSAHIVGINQLNLSKTEMLVYPNPARETATILNKSGVQMEKVELYNMLGQVVYRAAADSKNAHTMPLGGLSPGIYTIQVYTDKGTVARKLEVIR